MKKTLLLSLALAAAGSAFAATPSFGKADKQMFSIGPNAPKLDSKISTRAEKYMDFTYAGDPYTAISLNNTTPEVTRVFMCFQMTPADIKAFAGCKVTGFSVYSPTNQNGTSNTITDARFFYSSDLLKEDYTQDFTMSKVAFGLNSVNMDTPYTITGEEEDLFFGYSLVVPKSNNMYYVPVDYVENDPYTGWCGTSDDDTFPAIEEFSSFAPYYGALCMAIKIEGDNLPENKASIVGVDVPAYIPIGGNGINVDFIVKNDAANELNSVEVTASVTGMPDLVKTFDFSPLSFNQSKALTFEGINAEAKEFVDFSLKITKVNGMEFDGSAYQTVVPAYEKGFTKMIVAEDATGTWCGWCPGGIEALDYLKATYPDRAIAIGVHNDDPMAISEYQKFIQDYVAGFPNVWYNRMISQTPTDPYTNVCKYIDQVASYLDFPAYAEVKLQGTSSDDEKSAVVTASTEFAISGKVPHYLSFVIVEDSVGPYTQNNFFKQQRVAMNGWEKKAAKVNMKFNDVARYYNCYPGIKNSVPADFEADKVNEYTVELPLASVTGNAYRVVALLTNGITGEIVNAAECSLLKDNGTGVAAIEDSNAPVEYFNLNGQKVSNPSDGIFIRRQGASTSKVVIR